MNKRENNFAELKRLFRLKRHEVPPPGYFNSFSSSVIARIRAGEVAEPETFAGRLQATAPWLADFLGIFETKPALVGTFATGLCLLLVLGVVVSERSDSASTPQNILTASADTSSSGSLTSLTAPVLAASAENTGIVASTNPVVSLQPAPAMFGQQNPLFQSASFAPAGR